MQINDHTARPESWDEITRWALTDEPPPAADTLLELVGRIKRLEQAQQQQPAPSTPAGQDDFIGSVARAIDPIRPWLHRDHALAAILACADRFDGLGVVGIADALRREVGR